MKRGWTPDGPLIVTGVELARWLGVGSPALARHEERLVRLAGGYDLEASVAGYCEGRNRHRYAFAVLMQGRGGERSKRAQDRVARMLASAR